MKKIELPPLRAEFLLALAGLCSILMHGITPWGWPSLDMASVFVQMEKPGFIVNDLFTDCFSRDNGRIYVAYLVSLPMSLGLSWYTSIYLFMLLNSMLLPVACYLGLRSAINSHSPLSHFILYLAAGFAVIMPEIGRRLAIGWWSSIGLFFHSSLISISLLFLGVSLLNTKDVGVKKAFGSLLVFAAFLIHPAFALWGAVFLLLFLFFRGKDKRICIELSCLVIFSSLFFKLTLDSGSLTVQEYFTYFAQLHPEHYIPSRYVTIGLPASTHWLVPFAFVLSTMAILAVYFNRSGQRQNEHLTFALMTVYAGGLFAQYVFVELKQPIKAIIMISPIRMLAYGYWMLATLIALALGETIKRFELTQRIVITSAIWWQSFTKNSASRIGQIILLLVLVTLTGKALYTLPEPLDHLKPEEQSLIKWIETNTEPGAVIVAPPNGYIKVAIPLLTGRGVYTGNGFPFNNKCMAENYQRFKNVFGDPTGKYGRLKSHEYYDNLDLQHLSNMKPAADYVIVHNHSLVAKENRPEYQPLFTGRHYRLYAL